MQFDYRLLTLDFIVVPDSLTGEEALQVAGSRLYIVIQFSDGRWAVIQPAELYTRLNQFNLLERPLQELPSGAVNPHLVGALPIESNDPAHQAFVENLREDDILILLEGGQVSGLLVGGTPQSGAQAGMRMGFDYREAMREAAAAPGGEAPPEAAEESMAEAMPDSSPPAPAEPSPEATPSAPEPPSKRFINVELEDRDGNPFDSKEHPLETGEQYNLLFDVDIERRPSAIESSEFRYQAPQGEEQAVITVRLETEDFILHNGPEQKLIVPRQGRSENRAKFRLEPKHDGECLINAVFLKDGAFIQLLTLKFTAGELVSSQALGRGLEAAFVTRPRDLNITIVNTGAGFDMILLTPGAGATANLPIKLEELRDIAAEARRKLLEVVYTEGSGVRFFQQMIDIPENVSRFALKHLAQAGFLLYQRIFFGPSAGEQTRLLGRKLRELAQQDKLNIQIFSQDFVLPWSLLYLAERYDPDHIDPENFLGFKHIIEHIPLQPPLYVIDNRVPAERGLTVSLNLNTDIDNEEITLVGDQVKYWEDLAHSGARLSLIKRTTTQEVTRALSDPSTPDHILYFYCHGISHEPSDQGGVNRSRLVLSGNGSLTLEDLKLYAPVIDPQDIFANAPLVFINACESAELSPLIYDGFVPYFMSKGARGVIGTECETPALFAVEWARRFFDRFLNGEPLGQIFLDLRREFFFESNNPMGLLYSLYVDADTRVDPAVRPVP